MSDPFIDAVDRARRALIRQEGGNVSVREVLRRAGIDDSKRAAVSYHLNRKTHDGSKPHHVPGEVVVRLAAVLPISEAKLAHAAALAAGLRPSGPLVGDHAAQNVRQLLRDDSVAHDVKLRAVADILEAVADWYGKPVTSSATSSGMQNGASACSFRGLRPAEMHRISAACRPGS